MDALTNKLANALNDLFLECRAQGLTSRDGFVDEASMVLQEYRDAVGKEILAATDARRDMDAEPQELHALFVGNPVAGFKVVGPFADIDTMADFEDGFGDQDWWRTTLIKPKDYQS